MYYTYMLRCKDGSIYTGMTKDLERRMDEHFSLDEKCAKYTKRHKADLLEAAWESSSRSEASKLEYQIKKLSKTTKECLINDKAKKKAIFDEMKLEPEEYKRVSKIKINKINSKEKSP